MMPAMIDIHTHLGYRNGATFRAENFTRDNLLDQLNRFASYGVAAVASAGTDRGDLTFRLRDEPARGALVRTAGRGLAPPDAGPNPADAGRAVRRLDRRGGPETTFASWPPAGSTSSKSGSTTETAPFRN